MIGPGHKREGEGRAIMSLKGRRIIDLTQHLSGPFCTWTLRALGAEVIKVEAVGRGDGSRETPPFAAERSVYFDSLNRGKKSLALNLKSREGQEILHKLVRQADVLVENFRPGVRDRLGCSDAALKEANPKLIVCSITGFGQTGRYAGNPSYDIIVQAMSGMMSINGPLGSSGLRVGFSIGDIAAGLLATIGIISRLYERDVAGAADSRPLDISMLSCQLALLENAYARFLNSDEVPAPLGSRHPSIAPFETYSAADSDLVVALGTNAEWPRFCTAIEAPWLAEDPRFLTTPLRLKDRDNLEREINAIFKTRPRAYWLERINAANIACGPKVTIPEFAQSEYAREIQAFETTKVPGGELDFVRHPLAEPGPGNADPAPQLGQHTIELLRLAGYSVEQMADLRARGIVGYP